MDNILGGPIFVGSMPQPTPQPQDYETWLNQCCAFAAAASQATVFEADCLERPEKMFAYERVVKLLAALNKAAGKTFALTRGDHHLLDYEVELWALNERNIGVKLHRDGLFSPVDMSMPGNCFLERRFCTRFEAVLYALKAHPEAPFIVKPQNPEQLAYLREAARNNSGYACLMPHEPFASPRDHDDFPMAGTPSGIKADFLRGRKAMKNLPEEEEKAIDLLCETLSAIFKDEETRKAGSVLKLQGMKMERKISPRSWAKIMERMQADAPPELLEGFAKFQGMQSDVDGFEPWPGYPNLPKQDEDEDEKKARE